MRALELTAMLAGFERRGPGTDAERRAARRLAAELAHDHDHVAVEPFWCRPNWAMAHAWHVALALAGGLVSVRSPTAGALMLAAALVSILADELTGVSPGRRLTPERASQNVVALPHDPTPPDNTNTKLIVTANYDAGRTALVYRDALRRPAAWLRRRAGPFALGWLAWLSLAIVWSCAVAVVRATGRHSSQILGVIQLPPTLALVLALALLLEAAAARYGPAANDNASGSAVAVAVFDALSTSLAANAANDNAGPAANADATDPPNKLEIELVLAGAGEGGGTGLRRYLRSRRHELRNHNAIVLGIAPCGTGQLSYWRSDGPLIPLRYARPLIDLAADADHAKRHRGRGITPALAGRLSGLPALTIGCLDARGLAPRSHQPTDTPATIEPHAQDDTLEFALRLIAAIEAELAESEPAATPA